MGQLPVAESRETRVEEPAGSLAALEEAGTHDAVAAVAARWPTCLAAWASLGESSLAARRPVEAYAFFRVGYHRGLDRIRAAGWRGQGTVPWGHEGNRGFLRSLSGLARAAAELGENDEAARCGEFLAALAPDAPDKVRP